MNRKIYSTLFIAVLSSLGYLNAQDLKKDVTVTKAYQPAIQDANKISQMPTFNDTALVVPNFNYTISPVRLSSAFVPRPVSPAKMAAEPLKNLYGSYLKLGIGNPLSPLAELNISNTRSKENAYGLFLRHYSANGNIKLANGLSVNAPFSDNEVSAYGKHIFKQSVISGDLGFTSNKVSFYGYDTNDTNLWKLPNVIKIFNNKPSTQNYINNHINIALESLVTDSTHLYYKFDGSFNSLSDSYNTTENQFKLNGKVSKIVEKYYLGCEFNFNRYSYYGSKDTSTNSLFVLKPRIGKAKGEWRFEAGLDLAFGSTKQGAPFNAIPYATLDFAVVPSVIQAFVGIDGMVVQNSIASISKINPFIKPGNSFENTINNYRIFGGLKGNISQNIQFNTSVSFSSIDNQIFFVNDTNSANHTQFKAVYDNIEEMRINGEFDIKASDNLTFLAKGKYSSFSMTKQFKPWNMPNFEANISARYNLQNKILAKCDINYEGTRYAKQMNSETPISLKSFIDFNLGLEYRYTKILSVFLQIRNLTAAKYELWNQYPSYRFQIMAGFTYAL